MNHDQNQRQTTSWQGVTKWYSDLVGKRGHYYHTHVIFPRVLKLLHLKPDSSLLDLACGEGALARVIPPTSTYKGVDISAGLIKTARAKDHASNHDYLSSDVTKPLPLKRESFTHGAIILALQNIKTPEGVLDNFKTLLKNEGRLIIVLNHPCFRIPRQSSWEIDEKNKLQYRRINRYLSPLEIPITMNPGSSSQTHTWSFHHPLSYFTDLLSQHGFLVEKIEELASDKESEGHFAKMENRARAEIPLFMIIKAVKLRPRT